MKKWIALLLALVMCLSLCACGGGGEKTTPAQADNGETADADQQDDTASIDFDEIVVWENEEVTIALVQFYEKPYKWESGEEIEKIAVFKVTNHADHKVNISCVNEMYLDDESAYVNNLSGFTLVAPEKSGRFEFLIGNGTRENHTALDSIDDLYLLNGTFEVDVVDDDDGSNKLVSKTNADFDLREVIKK